MRTYLALEAQRLAVSGQQQFDGCRVEAYSVIEGGDTVVLVNADGPVSEAIGAATGVPVPVILNDCVVGDALSVTVRVAG